ncbi:MAG: LCP family protein [Lysinibacillus sp.]
MEQTRTRRYEPKRKKRRKVLKILLFLLLVAVGYGGYQFYAGMQLAKDSKIEKEDFSGDVAEGGVTNYLVLGVDSRGEEKSRTDTMMLVSWNRDTDKLKLVSFMRDIYAEIPNHKNYKLNTAYYLGGVQLAKDTISSMFDVPIHHYALIDFKNFESLIDIVAPNGVEIDVEKDMSENIYVSLKKGQQTLNGKELLGYARFRMDGEGDFGRVRRQQQVMEALKDQVFSVKSVPQLPKLIGATQGYITTDISSTEQLSTVLRVATSGIDVEKLTIPEQGMYVDNTYSGVGDVLEINRDKTVQSLHQFLEK